MPNFVAVEITDHSLLVACAKTSARRYQINQLFEIEAKDRTNEELGEALKEQLQQRGVSRADLIGVVSRRDAEMREVSVPPAPDNELPDLVRFQARNVFASLNDNWLFDFVPFDSVDNQQQKVLAMAIAPEIKTRLASLAETSGLSLKRILFRPYSITELFDAQLNDGKNKVIVLPLENRLDCIVTQGRRVAAARSFQSSAGHENDAEAVVKQVIGELRRTIASTKSVLNGEDVDEVIVAGQHGSIQDLQAVIKNAIDLPVQVVNPLGILNGSNFTADPIPEATERFAALIGSLANESSAQKPVVDFLNPRRPVAKRRDYRLIAIAAAGLGLLVLTGFALRWMTLSQQDNAIAKKQTELRKAIEVNKGDNQGQPGVDQVLGEVGALDKWYSHKVNWLEELTWISQKMLTADDIQVTRFQGTDTGKGFRMTLDSKMTIEHSQQTDWKKLFADRYEPQFEGVARATIEDSAFPVTRKFKLTREANMDETLDRVAKRLEEKLAAEQTAADANDESAGPTESAGE